MNEAGGCFSSSVTPWALCEVTFVAAVNACGQPGWPSCLEILQDLSSKKASNLWPAACRTYVTAQYPCHVAQVRSNQLITSSVITGSRCNWTLVLQLWFLLQWATQNRQKASFGVLGFRGFRFQVLGF